MQKSSQSNQQKLKQGKEEEIDTEFNQRISHLHKSSYLSEYLQYFENVALREPLQSLFSKLKQNKICFSPQDAANAAQLQFLDVKFSLHYEVIDCYVKLGPFILSIRMLNVEGQSPVHLTGNFSPGSSAKVYFINILYTKTAVKCFCFKKITNKLLLNVIYEYVFGVIASALEIGPFINRLFGFDIIIYKNCIEFSMEKGEITKTFHTQVIEDLKQNLKILHFFKIVHMDLKQMNTCYSEHFKRHVFIDFGYSKIIEENIGELSLTIFAGTVAYCSLQMLNTLNSHSKDRVDLYYNDIYCLKVLSQNISERKSSHILQKQIICFPIQKCQFDEIIGHVFLCTAKLSIYQQNFELFQTLGQEYLKKYQKEILLFLWENPINQNSKNFYNSFNGIQKQSIEFIDLKRAFDGYHLKNICSYHPSLPKYQQFCSRVLQYQFVNDTYFIFNDELRESKRRQTIRKIVLNCQINYFDRVEKYFDLYLAFISFLSEYYNASIEQKILASTSLRKYLQIQFKTYDLLMQNSIKQDSIQYCLEFLLVYCMQVPPFNNWKRKNLIQLFENYCLYTKNFELKLKMFNKSFQMKIGEGQQKYLFIYVMNQILWRAAHAVNGQDFLQFQQHLNQNLQQICNLSKKYNLQTNLAQIINQEWTARLELIKKFYYCKTDAGMPCEQLDNYLSNKMLIHNFNLITFKNRSLLNRFIVQILYKRIAIKEEFKDWNSLMKDLQLIYSIQPKDKNRFQFYEECIFLQPKYLGSKTAYFQSQYNRYKRIRNGSPITPLSKLQNSSDKLNQYRKNSKLINFDDDSQESSNALFYCRNFIKQLEIQYENKINSKKNVEIQQILIEFICVFDINYEKISLQTLEICKLYQLYKGKYAKIFQDNLNKKVHNYCDCFSKYDHLVICHIFRQWAFKYQKSSLFQDYFCCLLKFHSQTNCEFCKLQAKSIIQICYSQLYEINQQYQKCVYQLDSIFEFQFQENNFFWNGFHLRDFKRLLICSFALTYGNSIEEAIQNLLNKKYESFNSNAEIRNINKKYVWRFFQKVDKKQIYYVYFSLQELGFSLMIGQSLIVFLSYGQFKNACMLIKNVFTALSFCFSRNHFQKIMEQIQVFRRFLHSQPPQIVNKILDIYENQIFQERISQKNKNAKIIGQIGIVYMYLVEIIHMKQQRQSHFFIKRICEILDSVHTDIKSKYLSRFYSFLELRCNQKRHKTHFSKIKMKNAVLNNERKSDEYQVKVKNFRVLVKKMISN